MDDEMRFSRKAIDLASDRVDDIRRKLDEKALEVAKQHGDRLVDFWHMEKAIDRIMAQAGRKQISQQAINEAIDLLRTKLDSRLKQKGYGSFASRHEVMGVLREEMIEFEAEVHRGDEGTMTQELLDIAVGAIFAVACISRGGLHW